ncbi:helix-turn-helix transcriptional regulator [Actinomadura fulvescens]
MEENSAKRHRNAVGPVGEHVAWNVRRLRAMRNLSTTQLANRLTEAGRPILANAITKIEAGSRRVDVDDLVALAVVLGVNPSALLFPPDDDDTSMGVTGAGRFRAEVIWDWADGRAPLRERDFIPDEHELRETFTRFQLDARPPGRRTYEFPAWLGGEQ